MHEITTNIPELDAILEEGKRTLWTPEIMAICKRYYGEMAKVRKTKELVAYVNEKFDKDFTPSQFASKACDEGWTNE